LERKGCEENIGRTNRQGFALALFSLACLPEKQIGVLNANTEKTEK